MLVSSKISGPEGGAKKNKMSRMASRSAGVNAWAREKHASPRRCPGLSEPGVFGLDHFGRALSWIVVLVFILAWTNRALAQMGRVSSVPAAAEGIPATLDEALTAAMERNPEIATAKAKFRLAEAELNGTRMETARKLMVLWSERLAQEKIRVSAEARFENVDHLHKVGGVGGEDATYESAKIAMIDAAAKLARAESELRYLIGGAAPAAPAAVRTRDSEPSLKPLQMSHGPMVEKVRKALVAPTQLEFVDQPLREVMDYLKDRHDIEIQLDEHSLGMAVDGKERDLPITLNVKGIPLAAALQAIEDRYQPLKFVVRDYGILVTTRDQAEHEGYYPTIEFARLGGGDEAATTFKPLEPVGQPGTSLEKQKSTLKPVTPPNK
jgi:hypothetical protein